MAYFVNDCSHLPLRRPTKTWETTSVLMTAFAFSWLKRFATFLTRCASWVLVSVTSLLNSRLQSFFTLCATVRWFRIGCDCTFVPLQTVFANTNCRECLPPIHVLKFFAQQQIRSGDQRLQKHLFIRACVFLVAHITNDISRDWNNIAAWLAKSFSCVFSKVAWTCHWGRANPDVRNFLNACIFRS